ncbi:hypothetical protein IX51_11190 [uncultured archaeon]|nr:hypothetical protein IX51_11190 [uncultured archaeon]
MSRIGIFTLDFKFYHDVIKDLRSWNLPFTSIESPDNVPRDVSVILSSVNDEYDLPNQIKAENPTSGIRMALPRLMNKTQFKSLVIGIDPGPKPGIAVLADGVLLEAYECSSTRKVRKEVHDISSGYFYREIMVKIGDGDAPNRNEIIKSIEKLGISILVVDEKNTSTPHKVHDNALSAARIAQLNGVFDVKFNEKFSRKTVYEKEFTTLLSVIR